MTFNPVPKPKHSRRVPTQKKRNEFNKKTRSKIMEQENNRCQMCGSRATQIHHVYPRGRGGRGVYTNGMAICNGCHVIIHKDNNIMNHWQNIYEDAYGTDYYKDEWDD